MRDVAGPAPLSAAAGSRLDCVLATGAASGQFPGRDRALGAEDTNPREAFSLKKDLQGTGLLRVRRR